MPRPAPLPCGSYAAKKPPGDAGRLSVCREILSRVARIKQEIAVHRNFHKNREHVSRFLYKTTPNCASRARFGVVNSIESVVSIERLAMPGGFALPVWVCHSSIMRMRMESVTESCSDAVV